MSLSQRIDNLEGAIKAKTGGGMALFDGDGNEVEAELIQEPKPGVDGLAILHGKEIPVELQTQDPVVMMFYHDEPLDKGKLFMRRRDAEFIRVITAIPEPEDETG